jgi:copper chaperone CopZ
MNTELKIEGMTCGHCVAAVKRALEAVSGVESAEVSLAEGRARVRGTASREQLSAAVEEEGYVAKGA